MDNKPSVFEPLKFYCISEAGHEKSSRIENANAKVDGEPMILSLSSIADRAVPTGTNFIFDEIRTFSNFGMFRALANYLALEVCKINSPIVLIL